MPDTCPVCEGNLIKQPEKKHDRIFFECARCGLYSLTGSALATLPTKLITEELAAIKLSHVLYRMTEREPWPLIDSDLLTSIVSSASLPSLSEQLNNLVSWLASKQLSASKAIETSERTEAAVGVRDKGSFGFLCEHARAVGLIDGMVQMFQEGTYAIGPLKLTFKGWAYNEMLQRENSASHTAFMAMQFGDAELDAIYRDHFKAAVGAAGFALKRLDEGQPAGLIDDRLRVEIRQSRFLIADLTHHNKGAYWEAGYAEGLGKPVIYTCRKDAFDKGGTHFDTNHHLTVIWDPDNMRGAVEKLKATIRATMPGAARLTDLPA